MHQMKKATTEKKKFRDESELRAYTRTNTHRHTMSPSTIDGHTQVDAMEDRADRLSME